MTKTAIYLNFSHNTEEAFNFYRSVFGGEFIGNEFPGGIMRYKDVPAMDGMSSVAEADKNLIMHIELPLPGGMILMGSDVPESTGFKVNPGNNFSITLMPETRAETKKLFNALSSGGKVTMELQDAFWGDYYGSCVDKFGIQWMFDCREK